MSEQLEFDFDRNRVGPWVRDLTWGQCWERLGAKTAHGHTYSRVYFEYTDNKYHWMIFWNEKGKMGVAKFRDPVNTFEEATSLADNALREFGFILE